MSNKNYTVTVIGKKHTVAKYRVNAKNSLKAREKGQHLFEKEYGHNWDDMEIDAVADWVKKEDKK